MSTLSRAPPLLREPKAPNLANDQGELTVLSTHTQCCRMDEDGPRSYISSCAASPDTLYKQEKALDRDLL